MKQGVPKNVHMFDFVFLVTRHAQFIHQIRLVHIIWINYRFKKLDTDKSGSLSLQELLDLPQIQKNPLAKRIVGKLLI